MGVYTVTCFDRGLFWMRMMKLNCVSR